VIRALDNTGTGAKKLILQSGIVPTGSQSAAIVIDTNNNVGIGTTNNITQKLSVSGGGIFYGTISAQTSSGINWISANTSTDAFRITQTGAGNAFVVEDSTNPDSSPVVIDGVGEVGIGTTTPTRYLDVRGDYQFLHDPTIELTSPVQGYGDIVTFGTGTLTAGNLYYLRSDSTWVLARANSSTTSTGLLAIALGTSATTSGMLVRGYVRATGYTATTGAVLYVSSPTSGAITSTAPSAAGDVVRIVGYQLDATNDVIYFNPSNDWINI
jgi:hypothetical protein